MPDLPETLHTRRIGLFVVVTFGFSWAIAALIFRGGGLASEGSVAPGLSSVTTLLVVYMFGPALGHLAVRTGTGASLGLDAAWLRPNLRSRYRWYLIAWFLPGVLTLLGVGIYYGVFPGLFDPSLTLFREQIAAGTTGGTPPRVIAASQLVAALTVGPAINTFVAFGEEFGWRGFLLQHLVPLGRREAVVITGAVWGVWHWPVIAMGYNYGLGYPGAPWLGMLAMTWFTILVGTFLAWVTLRSGSVWAAAVGHGAVNAVAGYGILFLAAEPTLLFGPMATGVVASIPWLLLAAWLLWRDDHIRVPTDTG
ncbi:MAG: CPBP family intramembrane glutamic endopeptidase [Halodesulfurarchaeum sp.]